MGAKFAENIVVYIIKAMVCIKVIILKISIGDLTLYISAIDNFKSAIANILSVITTIYEDGLYVNNFFELISLEEEKSSKRELFFNGKFERIIVSNVWFKYPWASDYILKGVNLEIESGNTVKVIKLDGKGPVKRRIMDMGITKGVDIYVRKVAPLGDPVEVTVRGYELSLRKADAEMIEVE